MSLDFSGEGDGLDDVRMSGPMTSLLELLVDELVFNYTIHSPEDGQWGVPLPNGDWSGLVGMVYNNRADLALGPVAITNSCSRAVTFTSQVTTDYLTILAGFSDIVEASMLGPLMAFEWQVWLGLMCSLLACLFMVIVVDVVASGWASETRGLFGRYWWLFAAICSGQTEKTQKRDMGGNAAWKFPYLLAVTS
ncbi:probable glutamate receptor [Dermacentor silvarum]|uniref:probable glutamate receptor n=1 Tax=Dermacentor silvarum TaxID=543639 RepID=UPI0021019361|nr:probable glutamate receptor [Dermacentor silvarum]